MSLHFSIPVALAFLLLFHCAKAEGEGAEGNSSVVEAYQRLLLEPSEEHLLDAAIAAAHMYVSDPQTVEFLRGHLRETEGTVLVIDGEGYSDAELAYQCLSGSILDLTQIPARRVKGIIARWMEEENCPFRMHLLEISDENAARCDALAQEWLEGYRAAMAGEAHAAEGTSGDSESANWWRGYHAGKEARAAQCKTKGEK